MNKKINVFFPYYQCGDVERQKETVIRWKKQFEKRYLDYDEEIVPCEKGAFFCRINP